jgi:hypothetical protein
MESSVFILWHIHTVDGEDDEKLIGVYASNKEAQAAITRLSPKPGFSSTQGGFHIDEYELGVDHWMEGYVTT